MRSRTNKLVAFCLFLLIALCWPSNREDELSLEVRYHTPLEIYSLLSLHIPLTLENYIFGLLHCIYHLTLFRPMKFIYLHGPSLRGWGGWNGLEWPDICSQLSQGVQASFWIEHPTECFNQIDKQVLANSIGLTAVLMSIVLYFVLHYMINVWMMQRVMKLVVKS